MSDSGLDKIPDRTPAQARADIERKDRQNWFPAHHASGDFGILSARDGREVARCHKPADRDMILAVARNHDALKAALGPFSIAGFTLRNGGPFGEHADSEEIAVLGGIKFTFGDFRAAAAAIAALQGDKP